MSSALVLGGGGLAGIAWEVGLLVGLQEAGIDLTDAGQLVGTSAGSVVATWIATGVDLGELYDRQTAPSTGERAVSFDSEQMMLEFGAALAGATSEQDARARIGGLALGRATVDEQERLAIISDRLPVKQWPDRQLLITAVDTVDGHPVAFDRDAGVELPTAVAASCAVPGVWPPVTIGDRRYMDGGIRSVTNADLVTEADRVLVIAPMPGWEPNPFGPDFSHEIESVKAHSEVLVINADAASVAAFGTNPLDPATRTPSAHAGRAQAPAVADQIRAFWTS